MDLKSLVELSTRELLALHFSATSPTQFTLKNKSDGYVEFRIKSEPPELFFAIPVHGVLKPKEVVSVLVTLTSGKDKVNKTHKLKVMCMTRSTRNSMPYPVNQAKDAKKTEEPEEKEQVEEDFIEDYYKKPTSRKLLNAEEQGRCEEEIVTEVEGSSESYSYDSELIVLREELTKAEIAFAKPREPESMVTKQRLQLCQPMLLIFFCIGLFLGAYALS